MPDLQKSKGWQYIQETKFAPETIGKIDRPEIMPAKSWLKTYDNAPKTALPRQFAYQEANLWQILSKRRSRRDYDQQAALSLEQLGLILWAAQGLTAQKGPYYLRNAPSAGALYPIETYVCVERVNGLEPGVYHLNCKDFCLESVSPGSKAEELGQAAIDQNFCAQAALTFIWTALFRRNMVKYGHRGTRYMLLDAGHIAQNTALALTAQGLCGCPVAAFYDDRLNTLLGLDGQEESALYMMSAGLPCS